ncbi:MAG: MaoC family dehydratase [Gammaproteobacteria bacterium]|nr:MaoC family dehydratase [Gammaproteobacteria bacterium]
MTRTTSPSDYTFDNAEQFVGKTLGTSDWHVVTQESIGAFGDVTHDPDPNHIDPEWAREHGPYRFPIVFGFQTLSLLTFLCKDAGLKPSGIADEYNYGFDSVRFISPVPAGSRIRATCVLKDVRSRDPENKILTVTVEVEVEGGDRPALVADWLVMVGGASDDKEQYA